MFDVCADCGLPKKRTKSIRCRSCARIKQHQDGVFNSNRLDFSTGVKFCNFCNDNHEIVEGQSNRFWLLRKSKDRIRYECRKQRKCYYKLERQNSQKKLRKAVSNLIRDCLAKQGAFKEDSFPKYVDWTVEELKSHLESQFQEGMSWDNYGKGGWHIDHMVPDSWFNYSSANDEGFKKSWALENLQPLWAKDNCSKSNRYKG